MIRKKHASTEVNNFIIAMQDKAQEVYALLVKVIVTLSSAAISGTIAAWHFDVISSPGFAIAATCLILSLVCILAEMIVSMQCSLSYCYRLRERGINRAGTPHGNEAILVLLILACTLFVVALSVFCASLL